MKWKKFVLIGDSNTQFGFSREGYWVSELANLLQRKCDVINRGFSGYNTTHLRSILPTIMSEFDVDDVCGVTIMVGSNDSANNDIQHIPLEEYGENIRAMIDYLINDYKLERKRLILITPGRICDSKWQEDKRGRGEEATHCDDLVKDYSNLCRQIGIEKNIPLVDLYKLMEDYGPSYDGLLHDGLHLSARGSDLLFLALCPIIKKNIDPDLKFQFPYYRDIKPGQAQLDP